MVIQLRDLAMNAEYGDEIKKLVSEKAKTWHESLNEDQKKKLKDNNLDKIVEDLLNIAKDDKSINKNTNKIKKKTKNKKVENEKLKKKTEYKKFGIISFKYLFPFKY